MSNIIKENKYILNEKGSEILLKEGKKSMNYLLLNVINSLDEAVTYVSTGIVGREKHHLNRLIVTLINKSGVTHALTPYVSGYSLFELSNFVLKNLVYGDYVLIGQLDNEGNYNLVDFGRYGYSNSKFSYFNERNFKKYLDKFNETPLKLEIKGNKNGVDFSVVLVKDLKLDLSSFSKNTGHYLKNNGNYSVKGNEE